MTNHHNYRGFSIEILSAVGTTGSTQYWYQITGGGLRNPVETSERFDAESGALDFAKDFIDEHLVSETILA